MLLYGEWTLSCFLKEMSEVADMCRKVLKTIGTICETKRVELDTGVDVFFWRNGRVFREGI
jgi:hypothetical protein